MTSALETGKGSRLTIVPQRSPGVALLPLPASSADPPKIRPVFGEDGEVGVTHVGGRDGWAALELSRSLG